MTAKIALATCAILPEPDPDQDLLIHRLEEKGAHVRMLAWDGPEPMPEADEIVVVRSTWNYHLHLPAFLAWLERVEERAPGKIFNPAAVIRGNVEKTYLRDLEARVAVVPTAWAHPNVGDTMRARHWDSVVIKPVVSGGSFRTQRFTLAEAEQAQAFLDGAGRPMMIQRWIPAVDTAGERSLVWVGGELLHAVRKTPRFSDGHESVSESIAIADDERAFAERVLAPLADQILYARVDIIRDDAELRLMELELVEPSLFLRQHPPALERFASAIVALKG